MDTYELFAVRYATNPRRTRRESFLPSPDEHDGPMPMDFFFWVAVSPARTVLVDAGAPEATCRARGHDFLRHPVDGLAALGRRPADVTDVIVTHLHWDHAGNFEAFPGARIHLHPQEMAHATGPSMCHPYLRRPYDVDQVCALVRAVYGGRVAYTASEQEIAPGLKVHHVGGHTPGLQIVSVNTARGTVIVASDAMHYYANRERGVPFAVVTSIPDYLAALGRIASLAPSWDHVVAGHDPLVLSLYPAASATPGIARLDVPPRTRVP